MDSWKQSSVDPRSTPPLGAGTFSPLSSTSFFPTGVSENVDPVTFSGGRLTFFLFLQYFAKASLLTAPAGGFFTTTFFPSR